MNSQFHFDPKLGLVDVTTVFTNCNSCDLPSKPITITEFIAELQQVLDEYGDLELRDGDRVNGSPPTIDVIEDEGRQFLVI